VGPINHTAECRNDTNVPLQNGSWEDSARANHTKTIIEQKAECTETIDAKAIHLIIQKTYRRSHALDITIFINWAVTPRDSKPA